MGSSWTQLYYHIVFSTKGREPIILPAIESKVHAFIAGVVKQLGAEPYAVNGMSDHVYLLVRAPADLALATLVRDCKCRVTRMVHQNMPQVGDFMWQEGYGGFTVSRAIVPTVKEYVQNQKQHHRVMSFDDELRMIMKKIGMDDGDLPRRDG